VPRYRQLPVEVEAMRVSEILDLLVANGPGGMPGWLVQALSLDPETDERYGAVPRIWTLPSSRGVVEVRTRQGNWLVAEGDEWIVCAAPDDLWPVDSEVFAATYEPVA
jgi:hypothetical protein